MSGEQAVALLCGCRARRRTSSSPLKAVAGAHASSESIDSARDLVCVSTVYSRSSIFRFLSACLRSSAVADVTLRACPQCHSSRIGGPYMRPYIFLSDKKSECLVEVARARAASFLRAHNFD